MIPTVPESPASRHRPVPEIRRPRMAKADVRKPDVDDWRGQIGRAVARAMALQGWSLKEFAGAVGRDERQCARWISGAERAQLDALFAVPALRVSLLQAFAELTKRAVADAGYAVEIETTIRLRRTA